jgi:hypothetical protein
MGRFDIKTRTGLISPIIQGAMGVYFDTDAIAFFDRVTVAGGTLTLTEKNAVNQLVLSLKSNSLWTSMIAIYPMVGASAAACSQNLVSSSYTGTYSGGWTYTSTGVLPNGINGFMDTGINSNTVLSLNNLHFSVYLRTNIDSLTVDLGVLNNTAPSGINIFSRYTNLLYARLNEDDLNTVASTDSRGFKLAIRNSSTAKNVFNNNVKTAFSSNSISLPNKNIFISALNNIVGATSFYSARENSFASIGSGLSDTDASNLYTNVLTFQTSLSRNV